MALHLVPGSGGVEERLREGLGGCSTLTELLELLSLVVPNSTEKSYSALTNNFYVVYILLFSLLLSFVRGTFIQV